MSTPRRTRPAPRRRVTGTTPSGTEDRFREFPADPYAATLLDRARRLRAEIDEYDRGWTA